MYGHTDGLEDALHTFEPFVFPGGISAAATPDFQPFRSVEPVCNMLLMAKPGRKHPEIVNECEGKVEGDTLTMTTRTGQSYTAKLDGTEAPYKGDPGTTSVSVKRTGKNSFEETDKRDGEVIRVAKNTVSPDGKTLTVAITDTLHGTTSQFEAKKQ